MLKNNSIFFSALKQKKSKNKPEDHHNIILKAPVFDMLERHPSLNLRNKFTLDFWSIQVQCAVQKSQTHETFTCYRGICKHVLMPLFIFFMKIKHYLILQFLKLKLLCIQLTIEIKS